jgi:DHA2 family multidrug resistance protein
MIFPPNKRGTALAIWSMTTLIAPIAGPILGGWISDNFSWEWIFLINLPVGALCVFLCWRNLQGRETPTRKLPIDTTGFVLLLIWVGAFQVMLDTGKEADWFSSPAICVEAAIAVVGFLAWIIWELTEKHPIVDLSLFKSPNFALGTLVFCLGYAVFFGNALLLPLWLQTHMGYIATWAGLVAAPSGVVAVFLTPIAARILNQVDARWAATVAVGAFAASFWMRSGFTPDADFGAFVMPMLVQGVAMSVFFISMVTICLNGVPGPQVPAATGLTNFARITAGSFAASLVTTLQDQGASLHQNRLAEAVPSNDPAMVGALHKLGEAGLSSQQALGAVTHQFENQAFLLSTLDLFRISAWLCIVLLPLIWLTKPAYSGGGAHAAAD